MICLKEAGPTSMMCDIINSLEANQGSVWGVSDLLIPVLCWKPLRVNTEILDFTLRLETRCVQNINIHTFWGEQEEEVDKQEPR